MVPSIHTLQQMDVETDHKPLVFKKPIESATLRIQRPLLKLQPFQLNVIHKLGKEMFLWLILYLGHSSTSGMMIQTLHGKLEEEVEVHVHLITKHVTVNADKMERICRETRNDNTLITLNRVTKQGWPRDRKDFPILAREYWNYREDICEIDGIMMKSDKIIVPQSLRK